MLVVQLVWRRDTVGLHEGTRQGSKSALISPLSSRPLADGLMSRTGPRSVVFIPIRHGFILLLLLYRPFFFPRFNRLFF